MSTPVTHCVAAGLISLASLATAGAAAAQDIHLDAPGAAQILRGAPAATAGAWLDTGAVGGGDNGKDLIIGSPGAAGGTGRISILFRGPLHSGTANLDSTADATINGVTAGGAFGASTTTGYLFTNPAVTPGVQRDLVVAAPGTAPNAAGRVYVFAGPIPRSTFDASTARFVLTGSPGERFGAALATADLNDDGFREVIVGAPGSGRVYVFDLAGRSAGSIDSATANMIITAEAELAGAGVGEVIESGGDITGDGIYDLAMGAPRAYGNRGAVLVVRGHKQTEGWSFPGAIGAIAAASIVATGTDAGDLAGQSVTYRDIVEADGGVRDLIIGAPGGDGASAAVRTDAGEVYVLWGGSIVPGCDPHASGARCTRNLSSPDVVLYGAAAGLRTGHGVTGGDITRDNPDDLVLSAPGGAAGHELYVVYGTRLRSTYGSSVDLARSGEVGRRIIGQGLESVVVYEATGEGANDIIAGAPTADSGAGLVYVVVSPKLRVGSRTISLTATQCGWVSTAIDIANPSVIPLPWEVRPRDSWLKAVPANDFSASDRTVSIRVAAASGGLSPGTHTGTFDVASTSRHVAMFIRVTVNLTVQPAAPSASSAGSDFNGDGCGDTVIFRPSTGSWHVPGQGAISLGRSGDLPVPGDYNGDLIAEPAVYRRSDSTWHFAGSQMTWGSRGDIPVPGDYDGNGTTDIAVFNPVTAVWSVRGQSPIQWGQSGDLPVQADYDGDGRTEIAIYRRSSGTWLIRGGATVEWGSGYDIPVPADYNGDGRDDMAVYHRGRGVWKIKDQFTLQFGSDGDLPVAADFDRDGRADPALFRRATGTWLIHGTAAQLSLTVAGNAFGDSPALMRPYLAYGATTDFTADGWNDLVWLHQDGRIAIWQMNGTTLMGGTVVASRVSDFQWRIVGAADFNRDTHPDLLWQHADGRVAIWLMNGTALIEGRVVTQASDTRWRIGGTGDLDGDGHVDIVWQHPDGRVVAWLMNGTTLMRATQVTQVGDPDWLLAGAGDANGDGKLDLFWHHRTLGHVVIWIMNGTALVTGRLANGNVKDPNWRIVGAGDVNGDAQPDLVWQNQNGYAVAWIMDGENMTRGAALMPSMPSDNRWRLMAPR